MVCGSCGCHIPLGFISVVVWYRHGIHHRLAAPILPSQLVGRGFPKHRLHCFVLYSLIRAVIIQDIMYPNRDEDVLDGTDN